MTAGPGPRLSIDQQQIAAVGRILKDEADGKELRKELQRNMRAALEPGVQDVKQAVLAMPSQGLPHSEGGSLRQSIASQIKAESRLSGNFTGARIKTGKRVVRGFETAARNTNRGRWRHPVYGNTRRWVDQDSRSAGWFSETLAGRREEMKEAVLRAVQDMADRIAERSRNAG